MTRAEEIAETELRLADYIAAERAVTKGGQSYSIGNRSLTRADLPFIAKMIVELNNKVRTLTRGNQITCHRVVPSDN
jgi:hypothetical protein